MSPTVLKTKLIQATLSNIGSDPIEETLRGQLNLLKREQLAREPSFQETLEIYSGLFDEALEELEGFGPLKFLLDDPRISEILLNDFDSIFFEKGGVLFSSEQIFSSRLTYERFIKRILLKIDKMADQRHPVVDGVLEDGTRVHIVLAPVSKTPAISFRRHLHSQWSLENLCSHGFMSKGIMEKLKGTLSEKKNILICGPTGVGKTTLLRALLHEVSENERIITIEDTDEIGLNIKRGVGLFSRIVPENLAPPINLSDLLKHSLRMRPDRLVVGEIRSEEALVFLDSISTGHKGSMSSIHAGSGRQALSRLESLVSRGAPQWPVTAIRQMIYDGIDLIITVGKKEKCRQITEISEIAGIESFGILLSSWDLA